MQKKTSEMTEAEHNMRKLAIAADLFRMEADKFVDPTKQTWALREAYELRRQALIDIIAKYDDVDEVCNICGVDVDNCECSGGDV